jgi:hypothetical protein
MAKLERLLRVLELMTSGRWLKTLCGFLLMFCCFPLFGTTWYVRPDGGTRYSTNVPTGQCDGKSDAAYPGSGVNKHCAFKDVRMFWQDGSYTTGTTFPSWGWIGSGGDTYLIRGSIGTGVSYRVGWDSAKTYCGPAGCFGIAGDSGGSGPPPPLSGTATQHTRILGENYASCRSASVKTQLHGGWALGDVFNLSGSSYVDVACLDITDFSSCGRASQRVGCDEKQDFAQIGLILSNTATNDTLTDIHIHGMAGAGIAGPTGDGVVMDYVDVLGNASSGWNADLGNGTTGKGKLLVQHYNISWNGCAEEYPIVHPLPYGDCTDADHGGYGDGFGTTTKDSDPPGWQVHFDQGTASYNTQDGLDALHISGSGSSMTVTHSLAFSNMGQQIKVGGAAAVMIGNVVVGNCMAMSKPIPGTPPEYNKNLDLFCRAGDTAILINVPDSQPAIFQNNIIYSNNHVALEVEYPGDPSPHAAIKYDNNIFIGFPNSEGQNATPIYSNTDLKMFTNPGASFSNNTTYHAKSSWRCPATSLHETNGSCGDPHLKDETWHEYGYGDVTPGKAADKATGQSSLQTEPDRPDHSDSISYGSLAMKTVGAAVLATSVWGGWRYLRNRGTKV